MEKTLQEVLVDEDAYEKLSAAFEDRPYETPAERERLSVHAEALRNGQPVADALARYTAAGGPVPKVEDVPAKRPTTPRAQVTQEVYEQLAAAVLGEPYVPEAMGVGGAAVPEDDVHARLFRAITG